MAIPLLQKNRLRLRKVWFMGEDTCMQSDANFTIPAQQRNEDRETTILHFQNPSVHKGYLEGQLNTKIPGLCPRSSQSETPVERPGNLSG